MKQWEKEYLVAYGQNLQSEIELLEHDAVFSVRENWIIMGILDHAREISDKKVINCLHICSPKNSAKIKEALESLNINVEIAKLSKKVIAATTEIPSTHELQNYLQSMQIQVKPIIKKSCRQSTIPTFLFRYRCKSKSFRYLYGIRYWI